MPADVTIRPCIAEDAPALAALYAADRDQELPAEPSCAPAFLTAAGQLERITRSWPDHNCLGFVAVIRDQVVGLLLLEDIAERNGFRAVGSVNIGDATFDRFIFDPELPRTLLRPPRNHARYE